MESSRRFDSRLAALEALDRAVAVSRSARAEDASEVAAALREAAADLVTPLGSQKGIAASEEATARAFETCDITAAAAVGYQAYAIMLDAAALLIEWVKAVRSAELDSNRYVIAARLKAGEVRELLAQSDANALLQGDRAMFEQLALSLEATSAPSDVTAFAESLITSPLPLPWKTIEEQGIVVRSPPTEPSAATPIVQRRTTPPVGFLTFNLNGAPVSNPQIIRPHALHDLEVQLQLSRWPTDVSWIELAPLHVEPVGILDIPLFSFSRRDVALPSSDETAVTLTARGRLRVNVAVDIRARPLEITYAGTVIKSESAAEEDGAAQIETRSSLALQGQRHLSFESFDPKLNPISGFELVDERVIELRGRARLMGIPDEELAHFITLLSAAGSLAAETLQDGLFPGVVSEKDFQDEARKHLRARSRIGSELEEHPRAGAGITDLSFHRIRLELKAEDAAPSTIDTAVQAHGQQTAQYVAGSDRRCGVLVVLDTCKKTAAPGLVTNDIDLRDVPDPTGAGKAILLGVVIVRGNLSRPSDLTGRSR